MDKTNTGKKEIANTLMNNIPFISLADKSSSKILFSLPDNSVKCLYRKYYSIKFNLIVLL